MTNGGDIYAPATGDNTYIFYAKAEKLGTFTIPDASSCRNFTYPTNKANYTYGGATGYIPGDAAGATQFCTSA